MLHITKLKQIWEVFYFGLKLATCGISNFTVITHRPIKDSYVTYKLSNFHLHQQKILVFSL